MSDSLNSTGHDHYDELILRSLTEPLPEAVRAELDRHLATCDSCRAQLAEWRGIASVVNAAAQKQAFTLPPLQLDRQLQKGKSRMSQRSLTYAAAISAAIMTVFVIMSFNGQQFAAQSTATPTPAPLILPPTSTPTLSPDAVVIGGAIPYVIQEGDTFYSIMLNPPFNYSVNTINGIIPDFFRFNPTITRIDQLPEPGTTIVIPMVAFLTTAPIDPFMATATQIIIEATQTASGIFPPTSTPLAVEPLYGVISVTLSRSRLLLQGEINAGSNVDLLTTQASLNVAQMETPQPSDPSPAEIIITIVRGAFVIAADDETITLAISRQESITLQWVLDTEAQITVQLVNE